MFVFLAEQQYHFRYIVLLMDLNNEQILEFLYRKTVFLLIEKLLKMYMNIS